MALEASASKQRKGSASRAEASAGVGSALPSGTRACPTCNVCATSVMPAACSRSASHNAPITTRAAVSRALARSRTFRASSWPYLAMPARSAWPGRGLVRSLLRAISRSSPVPASIKRSSRETGSALMTFSHFGHSVFRISTAIGEPRVRPCRTPERMRTSSCSNFCRAPRP